MCAILLLILLLIGAFAYGAFWAVVIIIVLAILFYIIDYLKNRNKVSIETKPIPKKYGHSYKQIISNVYVFDTAERIIIEGNDFAFNQITGIIIKNHETDSYIEYSCSTNKICIPNNAKEVYDIQYTSLYIFIDNNSLYKFEFKFFNIPSQKDALEKATIELKNIIDKNKQNKKNEKIIN